MQRNEKKYALILHQRCLKFTIEWMNVSEYTTLVFAVFNDTMPISFRFFFLALTSVS